MGSTQAPLAGAQPARYEIYTITTASWSLRTTTQDNGASVERVFS